MLISERHQQILSILEEKQNISLQELVDRLSTSESTIRRDLSQLEEKNLLKRVHGGASLLHQTQNELSMQEKSTIHLPEKRKIAEYAAHLVQKGDCIFLDAGTTTYEMIPYLNAENLIVVTNGLPHIEALFERKIDTYLLGGYVKRKTKAMVGKAAQEALSQYRFDKSFIGVNGVHPVYGYTTPDPEEAAIKTKAIKLSKHAYVLADYTKFHEAAFAKIADLEQASMITNEVSHEELLSFMSETTILNAKELVSK